MDVRLCPAGHENPVDASFCVSCGRPIEVLNVSMPTDAIDSGDASELTQELPLEGPPLIAESESVSAGEVLPGSASPDASRRRLLKVASTAAGMVAFVVVGSYFLLTASVPEVAALTDAKARQALTDAGFVVGSTSKEFSSSVPRGSILRQDPSGGSRVRKGQAIALTLSRGPAVIVPDVTGFSDDAAQSKLVALKVEVDSTTEISDTVPKGMVIKQRPTQGTQVEQGTVIALVVSSGPPLTTVTATVDLSDVVLDLTWASCSTAISLTKILYSDATIVNRSGQAISSISGEWQADSLNGNYFPCNVVGTFPNTPTNEDEYRLKLSSTNSGNADWYTRAELESTGWEMNYG